MSCTQSSEKWVEKGSRLLSNGVARQGGRTKGVEWHVHN